MTMRTAMRSAYETHNATYANAGCPVPYPSRTHTHNPNQARPSRPVTVLPLSLTYQREDLTVLEGQRASASNNSEVAA